MQDDHQRTIQDIASIVSVLYSTTLRILISDLKCAKVLEILWPESLMEVDYDKVCEDLHNQILDDLTFMLRVNTVDSLGSTFMTLRSNNSLHSVSISISKMTEDGKSGS